MPVPKLAFHAECEGCSNSEGCNCAMLDIKTDTSMAYCYLASAYCYLLQASITHACRPTGGEARVASHTATGGYTETRRSACACAGCWKERGEVMREAMNGKG